MIIRAVSDSDSDDDLLSAAQAASAPRRSVFDPPEVASSTKGKAARYSWFAAVGRWFCCCSWTWRPCSTLPPTSSRCFLC
ncbi:hypothetical protein GQ600_24939 [Phytophthora cactorum]|nr:hypothetical protein GQ600_24939 [Phytophthora cactorum]